jgi:hypothetical protein
MAVHDSNRTFRHAHNFIVAKLELDKENLVDEREKAEIAAINESLK